MHAAASGKLRELTGRPNNREHKIPNVRWIALCRFPGHAEERIVPCIHNEPMIWGDQRGQSSIPRIECVWGIVRITDPRHQSGNPTIQN